VQLRQHGIPKRSLGTRQKAHNMKSVSQLTPYTCVAACLESYFADIAIDIDQCKILRDFPQYCVNPQKIEHFGIMSELQLICFAKLHQIDTTPFMFLDQPAFTALMKGLTPNDAVFVQTFWRAQTHHCVRFSRIVDEANGLFEFMCPGFGGASMDTVGFNDLMQWGFRTFLLKRIVVA
jgi:hypothetical protein